jgi:peptidoglycan hydrolase-like protein with peptidoglycan-binding domain
MSLIGEHGPELLGPVGPNGERRVVVTRLFNEALHKRGMGAQGGQFVASDGTKSSSIGYDGKRGSGYGSKSGDSNVKKLQKELNRLGITDAQGKPLAVDGKFGPRTTAAVRRLQRKLKLPVDGKITPALLKRIKGIKKTTTLTEKPVKAAKKVAKKAAPARTATPVKKAAPPAKRVPAKKTMPARSAR